MSRGPGVAVRTLREERRGLVGWLVGVAVLGGWLLAMFPSIAGNEGMADLLASYPESMRKMFQMEDFTTGVGYLRSEVFAFTMPLMLIIAAVLWGSDAVAGEEDRHSLDLLLAQPVSRRRVVAEKWAAVTAAVTLIAVALGVVLSIGAAAADLGVGLSRIWAAVLATALLAVLFSSVALAVGAATGRRGLARGVTLVVAVVSYLTSSLSGIVTWLEPARPFSPWYHTLGVDPVGTGFRPLHLLVLVVAIPVVTVAGAVRFDRRDLST